MPELLHLGWFRALSCERHQLELLSVLLAAYIFVGCSIYPVVSAGHKGLLCAVQQCQLANSDNLACCRLALGPSAG